MVAPCYEGMQWHAAKRRIMVGLRWQWFAGVSAVLLGAAIADC